MTRFLHECSLTLRGNNQADKVSPANSLYHIPVAYKQTRIDIRSSLSADPKCVDKCEPKSCR
jgi:hypothetical protein